MAAGRTTILRRVALGTPRPMPADDLLRTAAVGAAGPLIDLRDPARFAARHLAGSINIPEGRTGDLVLALGRDPSATLVCDDGTLSSAVCRTLGFCGYGNLFYLDGGLDAWDKLGGPLYQTAPSGADRRIVPVEDEPSTAVLMVRALSFRNLMIALAGSALVIVAALLLILR